MSSPPQNAVRRCSMACEKALVILFVSLCSSWCPRAEAADSKGIGGSMLQIAIAVAIASYSGLCVVDVWKTLERWSRGTKDGKGECISGFGPVVTQGTPIDQKLQVIIPSFQFNDSGRITAFHLAGSCGGGEQGVPPAAYTGTVQDCTRILQVWRPSGGDGFSIAANFTATLTVTYNTPVTTSVAVDEPIPFSSGDVLGISPAPSIGLFFQIAATSNQQPASHTYYTFNSFATELSTTGNRVMASPIISVEVDCCPSATLEPPELPSSSSLSLVSSPSQLPSASGDGISGTLPATSTAASMEGQTSQAPASSSPSATNQPASDPTSSSPVVTTSVAMTTSILSTSGGPPSTNRATSEAPSMYTSSTVMTQTESDANVVSPSGDGSSSEASTDEASSVISMAPPTGGQRGSDANAGLVAGVVVGVLLAVVMVVMAAIVLAVCSVRWRRNKKYALSCNVTYDVPYDAYIAANSNAEPAQYKMMPFSNRKGTCNGEYDVPCQMEELEHTIGARCYEVPCPSTLPPSFEAVLGANAKENDTLQGETHYNMGCRDDGPLCNPTAMSTDGNVSKHEYQEADTLPKSAHPLLEESVEQHPFSIYGFVPTVAERSQLKDDEDTGYQVLKEPQADHLMETSAYYNSSSRISEMGDTLANSVSNFVEGVYDMASTDADTYWSPSNKEEEIYAQMSHCKYQEIPRDKLKMLTKLGEGQFGEVYKAVLKSPTGTSQDVAVKLVKKGAPREERVKLLQEAATLGQFRHKHVVSLFGVVTLGEPKMMIMELLPGDLKSYLGQISETDSLRSDPDLPSLLLQFCKQVVDGLVCLAGKSFVHRDIAARNILLDKKLNCKISDFGMTREVESEMYYMLSKGTVIPVKWTAPEAILFRKYTTKSDIWSYGMLMYEIWSLGHKPFESNTVQEMVQLLDAHYCLPPPPGCPREVYSVMVDCWNPVHSERPTAADILGDFCKSERVLLGWRVEDTVPLLSRTLGAPLSEGETLHRDLQNKYKGSLAKQ